MAMMFRGLGKPTDQLDIQIAPQSNGLFDGGMGPSAPPMPMPAPAADTGKIGTGRMIAGYVGDALAQLGGLHGNFAPAMQQHQEALRRAQQAQLQRQAEMQDWVAKQKYKAANPDPLTPHYWETNDGSLGVVGPDGKPSILYKDPTPKMDTIQVRDPATGEVKWYRVPQGGGDSAISPQPGSASPNPASSFEPDVLLNRAIQQGFISPEDYASVKGKLGPNGQTALDGWMTGSKIKIGQQIDGKMYYQINGKWYDNPEGR